MATGIGGLRIDLGGSLRRKSEQSINGGIDYHSAYLQARIIKSPRIFSILAFCHSKTALEEPKITARLG